MVTIEVNLKEGDEEPEQHLDPGEHIERRIVPLTELYDTLHGTLVPFPFTLPPNQQVYFRSTIKREGQDCGRQVSSTTRTIPNAAGMLTTMIDCTTGHSAYTGASVFSAIRADLLECDV